MAIGANSYGSVAGVVALCPRYGSGGTFTTTTRPTLAQVEAWIDQVSALINGYLSGKGFAIPITQTDAVTALALCVNQYAADLAESVNGAGRLGPNTEILKYRGQWEVITRELRTYLDEISTGWERLGATRTTSVFGNVGYLNQTNSGGAVFPMFTRESFGGETFTEEDAA